MLLFVYTVTLSIHTYIHIHHNLHVILWHEHKTRHSVNRKLWRNSREEFKVKMIRTLQLSASLCVSWYAWRKCPKRHNRHDFFLVFQLWHTVTHVRLGCKFINVWYYVAKPIIMFGLSTILINVFILILMLCFKYIYLQFLRKLIRLLLQILRYVQDYDNNWVNKVLLNLLFWSKCICELIIHVWYLINFGFTGWHNNNKIWMPAVLSTCKKSEKAKNLL